MAAAASGARPVGEGLFTWPSDEPRLIGGRCTTCGVVTFPAQTSCPRCTSTERRAQHLLSRTGTLWTWTVQGFRPKSPPYAGRSEFEPYPVGYVELPGEVKVETLLVDVTPEQLEIGMEMELADRAVPVDGERRAGRDVRLPPDRPVRTAASSAASTPTSSAAASTTTSTSPASSCSTLLADDDHIRVQVASGLRCRRRDHRADFLVTYTCDVRPTERAAAGDP